MRISDWSSDVCSSDLRLQGLLARKGKKLAHQVGGAVGVLLDLHDVGERLVARPVAQQQQVGKADHRRQQVVEVVGDAAGELADRLHLLRLDELALEVLQIGRASCRERVCSVRVDLGGRRIIKKKKNKEQDHHTT